MKSILKCFYNPAEYTAFNEGVSSVLFPDNRLGRYLCGWRFVNWIFKYLPFGYRVILGERLFEIPVFWMNFAGISATVKRVLDFGCCESKISLHLAALGYDVSGIDLRDSPYQHVIPKFIFTKGDIFENYENMGSFDLVVAISAIEHVGLAVYGGSVKRDDNALIRVFSRLLNSKGYLYVTVPFGEQHTETDWLRIYNEESINQLFKDHFQVLKTNVFALPKSDNWNSYSEKVWCGLLQKR